MARFEIEGEAVIPKNVSKNGVIYGFKEFAGREVKVVVLNDSKKSTTKED